jgi:hypothetical protein
MKFPLFILVVLFCAVAAPAATWQQTVTDPADVFTIPVDIGTTIVSLESVAVHLAGIDKVGGYSCDGMDGSYYLPEIHYVDGTFGQDGNTDDMSLRPAADGGIDTSTAYDFTYEFNVSDPFAWAFLDDGPIDFSINCWTLPQEPSGGFCMHIFGEFSLDTMTLMITYNSSVPTDASTWSGVKTLYR